MPEQTKEIERLAVELRRDHPEAVKGARGILSAVRELLTALAASTHIAPDDDPIRPAAELLCRVSDEASGLIVRAQMALSEEGDPHG